MITISDFGRGCERQGHFRNDIGRPARGETASERKRVTNAPQVRDGKIILQSQQNFQSSEKCVGHESHSDSVPFFLAQKRSIIIDSAENLLAGKFSTFLLLSTLHQPLNERCF